MVLSGFEWFRVVTSGKTTQNEWKRVVTSGKTTWLPLETTTFL